MYKKLLNDWEYYTSIESVSSFFYKLKRVKNNPGMKMVLLHRLINETPNYMFFLTYIFKFFYYRMMYKYGIDLPLSLKFGTNLRIYHWGGIVINPDVKIGNNVTIMHNVTLGNNMKNTKCPQIEDNVFIGVGAKVLGDVYVAKGVKIGANAVVVKSIFEENVTVVGIPAKVLGEEKNEES